MPATYPPPKAPNALRKIQIEKCHLRLVDGSECLTDLIPSVGPMQIKNNKALAGRTKSFTVNARFQIASKNNPAQKNTRTSPAMRIKAYRLSVCGTPIVSNGVFKAIHGVLI